MNCDRTTTFLNVLIAVLATYNLIASHPPLQKWAAKSASEQQKVTTLGPLLNPDGGLASAGWSTRYNRVLNLDLARPNWKGLPLGLSWSLKKLDRFVFSFNRRIFYISFANSGHLAVSTISFFDFESNELLFHHGDARLAPFGLRSLPALADDPFEQDGSEYVFESNRNSVRVYQGKNPMKSTFHTTMNVAIDNQLKAKLMTERFVAQNDFFEAVATAADPRAWAYSLRSYESVCEGFVSHLGKYHSLLHSNCVSVAAFDRGLHRYKTNWVWATGQGKTANGTHLALNFGAGVADVDSAGSSEDFFKSAGVIHKLSPVEMPAGDVDWSMPVTFRTAAAFQGVPGSADVKFFPRRKVVTRKNYFAFSWDTEVVFGVYSGHVVGESGAEVSFEGVTGLVEVAKVKW